MKEEKIENVDQYLKKMRFKKIGKFFIKDKKFIVECDEEFLSLDKMIYIHTIEGEILRVGSSKNKLRSRMKSWETDVTKSLNNQKSGKKKHLLWIKDALVQTLIVTTPQLDSNKHNIDGYG